MTMTTRTSTKHKGVTMKVFTTGQVAKICKVAPRTVAKWFDSGRLKGYRIPGSQDRRIPREYLVKFLAQHGIPLGDLAEPAAIEEGTDDTNKKAGGETESE